MNNNLRTIIIVVEEGFTARSLLRSNFLTKIKENFERIVIVAPKAKLDYYNEKYCDDRIIFEPMDEDKNSLFQRAIFKIIKYSIHSNINKIKLLRTLYNKDGKVKFNKDFFFFPILFLCWFMGQYRWWRFFLRMIYSTTRLDGRCIKLIDRYKPMVVFANYSDISVNNFNLKLIRASKKRKIKTVGNIFSWDNLFSKVFITDFSDCITVPNGIVRDVAVLMDDVDAKKIMVVGLPHFDVYFNKNIIKSKEYFFREINADINKKLIVFAIGIKDAINENHFLDLFNNLAKSSFSNIQFYIRPYPKVGLKQNIVDKFKGNVNILIENRPAKNCGVYFEFFDNDPEFLANLLLHSDVLITYYSTIIIESCITDTPIINLNYSGGLSNSYYHQIQRYYYYDHIKQILDTGCAKWVNNDKELVNVLKQYLDNPLTDRNARKKTVIEQLSYIDGKSAERLFLAIRNTINSKND